MKSEPAVIAAKKIIANKSFHMPFITSPLCVDTTEIYVAMQHLNRVYLTMS